MKARPICGAVFGLLIAGLAGCAANSVKDDFTFKDDKSEGLVFFSASHDLAGTTATKVIFYVDGGVPNGGSMVYSLEQNPLTLTGRPGDFEDSHGRLIALALPVGKHQFTGWQVTDGTLQLGPASKLPPLEFSLQAGQVKYLGNLHARIQMRRNFVRRQVLADAVPEIRDMHDRDVELFKKRYPQFKDQVSIETLPLGLWTSAAGTSGTISTPPVIIPVPRR